MPSRDFSRATGSRVNSRLGPVRERTPETDAALVEPRLQFLE
jgi:hypothetical protein